VEGYNVCKGTVGNEEVSIYKELLIYPNPSNSLIRFDLPVESDFEVAVYNSTWQQIHHSINSNQIDLSRHTDGIYFIEVRTKTTILKGKIIRKE
jgi:hypothetical protein